MKKSNYESLLDAFRELSSVSDEEVLTPKTEKLVKEGKEFSLNFAKDELDAAREALNNAKKDDEIEVIDVNADTLDHVKDKKEYVGQVIVQCNRCHSNKFIDMGELVADETDPELYNVEDECPNCHATGDGFELVGQVSKVVPETHLPKITSEPEVDAEDVESNSEETEETEEPSIDNDIVPEDGEASFENNNPDETAETEDDENTPEEPAETKEGSEEVDFKADEESDGMETTASEDEDELNLPELGDEFDADEVRKDDTEEESDDEEKDEDAKNDEDEDEDEEKVKEELEPKPIIKRKLRLPTREALEEARQTRINITEELFNKFALPESINKVIITSQGKTIYEGLINEMPETVKGSNIDSFNVANGFLMCNVDLMTDTVDTPLAKVLNIFNDDETTKICVWDVETGEELFQGSKEDVLNKFGYCKLISLDAPKTLRLTINGEHKCKCGCPDGKCVCDNTEHEEASPAANLLDNIFKANNMAKYNADDQRSEEFWIAESVYGKEDLPFVYERYIKGMSKELVEEFKKVTGFKDEIDEFEEKHNVKVVSATEIVSKPNQVIKSQAITEDLENKVISCKTRKALSEQLNKIKGTRVEYKVRRSLKEGYRYDLILEGVGEQTSDFDVEDYMKEAQKFAAQIKTMPIAKVKNLYYDDYKFDDHDPDDDAEKLIADALVARIKEVTGEDPTEISTEDYLEEAKRFAKEIEDFNLVRAEELYYDEYGFDVHAPDDEAEKIIAAALVARIKEISANEPVIAGNALKEDFEEEDVSDDEIEEEFVENSGNDLQDSFGFLSNDELEAIAGYKEVIEFFEKKGVVASDILDKLRELQEDEEEHLDELKELFKAVTGEELVEIPEEDVDEEDLDEEEPEEDVASDVKEPAVELEVVPVEPEKATDEALTESKEDSEIVNDFSVDAVKDEINPSEIIPQEEQNDSLEEATEADLNKLTSKEKEYLLDYMGYNFENDEDKEEILADISPESILSTLADETRDWSNGEVTPDDTIEFTKHLNLLATIAKKLSGELKESKEDSEIVNDEKIDAIKDKINPSDVISQEEHYALSTSYLDETQPKEVDSVAIIEKKPEDIDIKVDVVVQGAEEIEDKKVIDALEEIVADTEGVKDEDRVVTDVMVVNADVEEGEEESEGKEEQPAEEIVQEDPDGELVSERDSEEEQNETVEESYSRQELIDAVMDAFGFTKGEALEYIKKASEGTKLAIIKGFKQDAKKNLYEGVSSDNPFLKKALDMYKNDPKAMGVIVSFRPRSNGHESAICKLYYSDSELKETDKKLRDVFGDGIDVSAIHDRGLIAEYEKSMNKSVQEAVFDIKPFFADVTAKEKSFDDSITDEVEFDTKKFDEDLNRYFDEAYAETVIYRTEGGTVDTHGKMMLEGILTSDKGETNVMFTLTPLTDITESLDTKLLSEKIRSTTFKVKNNLSEEVFTFDFTSEK